MAYTTSIKYYFFKLTTLTGDQLLTPLGLPDYVWQGEDIKNMPNELRKILQTQMVNKGQAIDIGLMNQPWELRMQGQEFEIKRVSKDRSIKNKLNRSLQKTTMPQYYDFFVRSFDKGYCIAYIPALSLEVFSLTEQALLNNIAEQIQSEYVRHERFKQISTMIQTQWYSSVELLEQDIDLTFYSAKELRVLQKQKPVTFLPKVAKRFHASNSRAFKLEQELQELALVISESSMQSVLLVGAEGCGKSALLDEYLRQHPAISEKVWETNASSLLQGLSLEAGWQQGLALLIPELRENRVILLVGHLIELFEVGQYQGNNISIGEALKEPLQRGEICIVAEVTEAELAALTLRAASMIELFTKIQMRKKTTEELEFIVHEKVVDLAAQRQTSLSSDAIYEILRLQKRYTPYSGLPGKTIRFFESLIIQLQEKSGVLDRDIAIKAFCDDTGMPAFIVDQTLDFDQDRALKFFNQRVFGQQEATNTLVQLLLSVKTAMLRSGKPIASFLFVGPTGVGKTEMAKTLAEFMFANQDRVLRYDMSEYSEPNAVLRLTGEWGGAQGSLISQVRQQAFSVVLLDEIEKAHYSFFDILLQVLGEGRLTDARGNTANFCSTIVVMTSNIGAVEFMSRKIGFSEPGSRSAQVKETFNQAIHEFFRPELINRIDQIIPFLPLSVQHQKSIVKRELDAIAGFPGVSSRQIEFVYSDKAIDFLVQKGNDSRYGARPLKRVVSEQVVSQAARTLNVKSNNEKIKFIINCLKDKLDIKIASQLIASAEFNNRDSLADKVSKYRNTLYRIVDGVTFNALLSKLDMQDDSDSSANDKYSAADYVGYKKLSRLKTDVELLLEEIAEMEAELLYDSIANLPSKKIYGLFDNSFNAWLDKYYSLSKSLYEAVEGYNNRCLLAIYGPEEYLETIVQFYMEILDQQKFSYEVYAVSLSKATNKYHCLPEDQVSDSDSIIGFVLKIYGSAVVLYLDEEVGVHEITVNDEESYFYYLELSQAAINHYAVPKDVHRQQFYYNRYIRRTIYENIMTDSIYEFEMQADSAELAKYLQERQKNKIEAALI